MTARYRMPAEWERHRATWISWPHHEPDWPGKLAPIPWVYAEIARVLDRSHAWVRVTQFRAVAQLRNLMTAGAGSEEARHDAV